MIIKSIWESLLYGYFWGEKFTSPLRILVCILLSIIALPFDILLIPLELIAFIIYKIIG